MRIVAETIGDNSNRVGVKSSPAPAVMESIARRLEAAVTCAKSPRLRASDKSHGGRGGDARSFGSAEGGARVALETGTLSSDNLRDAAPNCSTSAESQLRGCPVAERFSSTSPVGDAELAQQWSPGTGSDIGRGFDRAEISARDGGNCEAALCAVRSDAGRVASLRERADASLRNVRTATGGEIGRKGANPATRTQTIHFLGNDVVVSPIDRANTSVGSTRGPRRAEGRTAGAHVIERPTTAARRSESSPKG